MRNMLVEASVAQVWEQLSDGWSYAEWVVGTRRIRAVDPGWPEVGTGLTYQAGLGPFTFEGRTWSRLCVPPQQLELEAVAAPGASVRISVRLMEWDRQALVVIDEHPLRGPHLLLENPVVEMILTVRNRFLLRRLAELVKQRPPRS